MKGEIAVRYTIRHFDLPLLTFEANMDSADTDLHIIKVYEEKRSFLPLNLTVSEDGVERWLRHRAIPKNRAYVDALLSKVGLSLNRPLGIIATNKGLSLNDCFWVDAEGSGDTFEKVNLYDNRFSQVLAAIAFTGYGSSIRTSLASCPEFSTCLLYTSLIQGCGNLLSRFAVGVPGEDLLHDGSRFRVDMVQPVLRCV